MMKIEFIWNSGFAGRWYELHINDKEIDLGLDVVPDEDEAKERIIEILKKNYNIDYTKEEIKFTWGGCL